MAPTGANQARSRIYAVVPHPDAQFPAVGQVIHQPLGIFPEAGTAVHGDPAGHSVLWASPPPAPEVAHMITVVPGSRCPRGHQSVASGAPPRRGWARRWGAGMTATATVGPKTRPGPLSDVG